MAYRNYRRKGKRAGGILSDTSYIANRLSWAGCIFFGILSFVIFYWIIPIWLVHQLNSLEGNMFRPMIEVVFSKRIHWVQRTGIALGLICMFFAIRNYYVASRLDYRGENQVSFISRLIARFFN